MPQPQLALVNWWMNALKDGRQKIGDTFECRQGVELLVTPEAIGCSTPGSIYNLFQIMTKAGLFTRAGDGHLAVGELWEACNTPDDVLDLIKRARYQYPSVKKKLVGNGDDAEEPAPEPEPPALEFNLFDVLDQLTEAERVTCAMGLISSLTTRAPELERTVAELTAELQKRDLEISRLIDIQTVEMNRVREELKNERANAMMMRQELESKRVSVARTIEKIITVDSGKKPVEGGQWSNAGSARAGAAAGPRVIMHRKPQMGHVPKVVREHLQNGHTKSE
jgi:hypothetical protein